MKTDTITITITGSKKFRQQIVDLVYEALMDEDIQVETTKNLQNGFTLESSLVPSEDKQ